MNSMDNDRIVIPLPSLREKFRNELLLEAALFVAVLLTASMLGFGLRGYSVTQWLIPLLVTGFGAVTAAKLAGVSIFKLRLSVSPEGDSIEATPSRIIVPVTVLLSRNAFSERTDLNTITITWAGIKKWAVLPATSAGKRRSPARHKITVDTAAGGDDHIFISREDLGPAADELLLRTAHQYCPVALDVRDVSLLGRTHDLVEG